MRLLIDRSLAAEFFGGREEIGLEAASLFALVDALDGIAPGFADIAPVRATFAVDGEVRADWSAPLTADSEVYVLPRIGGGEQALPFRVLSPLGVEVLRDLSQPFSPAEADHFRDLVRRHSLILARGQSLTMERQRELCALLGPILDRKGENGYMSNEGGGSAATALTWHADAAYTPDPFDALSLHALDVVDDASWTRFVSAEDAFDSLPGELRSALESRDQSMIVGDYAKLAERTCDQRDPVIHIQNTLPATHVNPNTGRRCIWTSAMQTQKLLGMEWEDSRDLLHRVYDHLYAPERVFEHRWRNGDFIVWDNMALQHSRGNLDHVGNRLLQRAIVGKAGVAPHYKAD